MLKYEGLFEVGQTIRVYDYNPDAIGGRQVFSQGVITDIIKFPFMAYRIKCERCTYSGRIGKVLDIPMEKASHEFDNRILLVAEH